MTEVLKPSWTEIIDKTLHLASSYKESIKVSDFIIGMSRGGLIPAAIIATKYNKPLVAAYIDKHDHVYIDKQDWLWDKNLLIVDDICRSGLTLNKVAQKARTITFGKVRTLTLYNVESYNKPAHINPVITTPTKIDVKFPWDYDR